MLKEALISRIKEQEDMLLDYKSSFDKLIESLRKQSILDENDSIFKKYESLIKAEERNIEFMENLLENLKIELKGLD